MFLRVKSLNEDASFMLQISRENKSKMTKASRSSLKELTIIIDPWLKGASIILHKQFSYARHIFKNSSISLFSLPPIDFIIISQATPDHCHRETLIQLSEQNGGFLILAEPAAANLIRSWKHFAQEIVITLPNYEMGTNSAYTILLPEREIESTCGELTVTLLSQKRDIKGLFKAIGITYKPVIQACDISKKLTNESIFESTISVLFAPHGINMEVLEPWVSTHLYPRNAFPITTLFHCFNRVTNPVCIGGTISQGLEGGHVIAEYLQPSSWISCHDGVKMLRGVANRWLKIKRYSVTEVRRILVENSPGGTELEVISMALGEERWFEVQPRKKRM